MTARQRLVPICLLLLFSLVGHTGLANGEVAIFSLPPQEPEETQVLVPNRDPFNWPPAQLANILLSEITPALQVVQSLTLQAIFWDEELPQAVINQKILYQGDEIDGINILRIDQEKVIVELDNYQYTLQFEEIAVDFGNKDTDPEKTQ
ncbi:MAG: hypothetical protein PF442_07475 [Desulfobulbaceae bacterium]|jgi:hypothetical protein|nr:hypothetical protein [Desulfobulbaceae bacterium]